MTATIRKLTPDDRDAWTALWKAYCDFYRTDVPDKVTQHTWRTIVADDGPIWAFGAETDGRLVGFVTWLFHPVTWAVGPRCYLEDLFVATDARGQGAGRALMRAVHAEAVKEGADQLYWLTHEANATARGLYDTLGDYKGMIKYRWR